MASLQTVTSYTAMSNPAAPLGGRRLAVAHAAWLVVTLVTVLLDLVSIPLTYRALATICVEPDCNQILLTPARLQELQAVGLGVGFHAGYLTGLIVLGTFAYIATGIFIFLRQSRDRMALFASISLIIFGGAGWTDLMQSLAQATPAAAPVTNTLFHAGQIVFFILFCVFPDGRFTPRWTRWVALAWALLWVEAFVGLPALDPLIQFALSGPGFLGFIAALVVAQVYRYQRRSTPRQQRQTKWVVFGLAIGLGGFATVQILDAMLPFVVQNSELTQLVTQTGVYTFITLIPITIGIAMKRSRLYEIDTLINRALVYGALTGAVALVYFSTVLLLQQAVDAVTGQMHSDLVIVASTLGVAALFQPLRRRFQAGIDRRFYRHKYDAAQTLDSFSATLRDEVDLTSLTDRLTEVVNETMQPTQIALWLQPVGRAMSRTPGTWPPGSATNPPGG